MTEDFVNFPEFFILLFIDFLAAATSVYTARSSEHQRKKRQTEILREPLAGHLTAGHWTAWQLDAAE
ncbi:hypothetical protein BST61_g9481 [Cercospora zeina]